MSAIRAYYRDIHPYTLTDCNLIRFLIKAETNMNNVNNSPINIINSYSWQDYSHYTDSFPYQS